MNVKVRATIYLDEDLHRAVFEERADEPVYAFEEVVRMLRERGKL